MSWCDLFQMIHLQEEEHRLSTSEGRTVSSGTGVPPRPVDIPIISVQLLSRVRLCDPMDCSTPGFPVHHQLQSLLKLMSIESVMPSNHLILCHPLLLPPSIFTSIRVFSHELALCIKWPKYWSFSFSISPSNEYSGPISFRMDWLDLIAVQGTLKSLLQHHSSKGSVLRFLSFLYSPTLTSIHDYWKNHSLDWMDLCWQSKVSVF